MRTQSEESAVAISPDSVDADLEKRNGVERRASWRLTTIFVSICFFIAGVLVTLTIFQEQISNQAGEFHLRESKFQSQISNLQSQVKNLSDEFGLVSSKLVREREKSMVQLYAWGKGHTEVSYGTAIYLGHGYFLTVKHAVVQLNKKASAIDHVDLVRNGHGLRAQLVDSGTAIKSDTAYPGDWAIIQVSHDPGPGLEPVVVNYTYPAYAETVFRLGNDSANGIVAATGKVGPTNEDGIASSLIDSNQGSSGGAVMNQSGELVGLSIGSMGEAFHYACILPLRREMFRKVPHLSKQ